MTTNNAPLVCGGLDAVYVCDHFMIQAPNADSDSRRSECFGSYNPNDSLYTDVSVGNDGRSWTWIVYVIFMLCAPLGSEAICV